MSAPRLPHETWDGMLPGPPSRSNGGCADCSPTGLLAYGSGSSVAIVDTRSMQLVSAIPMPAPTATSLAPFVTAVRWTPQPLHRDLLTQEPSNSHLRLAVGDRQGRIALLDFRLGTVVLWFDFDAPDRSSKLGVQDLCWVHADSWLLASISGPSLLSLWNASTGRCIWKYDASPEYFSCMRRDPFDDRHLCAVGLKGFLLSVKVIGDRGEDDIVILEQQIPVADATSELQRLEKEVGAGPFSPALAVFPLYFVRLGFSPHWRHILFVTFPKELVVFDLQYGATLSSAPLPRGCGKFMDVVPDLDNDLIYCAHLDGKLTSWNRKEGEQVHVLCTTEDLMPSMGTTVPSPTVLAIISCQSECALQNIARHYSDMPYPSSPSAVNYASSDLSSELHVSETYLIAISDDGKIWNWLLTAERAGTAQKTKASLNMLADADEGRVPRSLVESSDTSVHGPVLDVREESGHANQNGSHLPNFSVKSESLKISLAGQLHLLSSTVTVLAVPCPSLTATLARGGNKPAVAVPFVALGTQSGTVDVIDVSANAVAASFSVHTNVIRGLRWLGNSRLVSFSYSQVHAIG